MSERYKVWYHTADERKPKAVYVDTASFVGASLTAQERLGEGIEITRIIHCESGLDAVQLEKYQVIHAKCYEARWFGFGDEEKAKESLKERVDFEYYNMPNLEFANMIREQLYIPPYHFESLPDHLKEVVEKYSDKEKSHSGNE